MVELHSVWDAEQRKGKVKIQGSSELIFASFLDMFKHTYNIKATIIYNINAPNVPTIKALETVSIF